MKRKSKCPKGSRRSKSGKTCRKTSGYKKKSRKKSGKKSGRKSRNCKYTHVNIKKSTRDGKKFMAVFKNKNSNKTKTIHFGQEGASDFTKHKDTKRRSRYLKRHKKRENWNKCDTAGSLSRWILWNKTSRKSSENSFKNKFKLK